MEQQESNRAFYIVIGLLVVITIIGVSTYIFFGEKIKEIIANKSVEEEIKYDEYTISILNGLDNLEVSADYKLYANEAEIQSGKKVIGVIEKFGKGINNTNYSIEVSSEGYYYNVTRCNNFLCQINVMPIGDYYFDHIALGKEYQFFVKPINGTLYRNLLCVAWSYQIKQININATLTQIPSRYLSNFDRCYDVIDGYMTELTQINAEVDMFDDDGLNKTFTVKLIDLCQNNKGNIFEGCAEDKEIVVTFI